ncbi:hypothetical protein ACJIZ3_010660 [Penstemon smallii]|uniref:Uncharacterized protein n=1 Tax=Penstemon smallii TaxID=265156 RepID=A0ABD3UL07_9LAMI
MIASTVDEIKKVRVKAKNPICVCSFMIFLELSKALVNIVPKTIPANIIINFLFCFLNIVFFFVEAFRQIYREFQHVYMPREAMAPRLKAAEAESSPDVGSSSRSTEGSCTKSTPIDTLRFSPPDIPLLDSLPILAPEICSNPSSFNKFSTRAMALSRATLSHFQQCGFSCPTRAGNCGQLSWAGLATYVVQYTFGGYVRTLIVTKIRSFDGQLHR